MFISFQVYMIKVVIRITEAPHVILPIQTVGLLMLVRSNDRDGDTLSSAGGHLPASQTETNSSQRINFRSQVVCGQVGEDKEIAAY